MRSFAFARHWQAHNDQVLAMDGPLWVVLGDSTAQGLGAPALPCVPRSAGAKTAGEPASRNVTLTA